MLQATDRQTDRRQTTDGQATANSEREPEFTFAKKSSQYAITDLARCVADQGPRVRTPRHN